MRTVVYPTENGPGFAYVAPPAGAAVVVVVVAAVAVGDDCSSLPPHDIAATPTVAAHSAARMAPNRRERSTSRAKRPLRETASVQTGDIAGC
jgi:hypothetical protein